MTMAGAVLGSDWTHYGLAQADQGGEASAPDAQQSQSGETAAYHTPLAGEPLHAVVMGQPVDIPARDRGQVTALTLGGVFYAPKQGDTSVTPIGALFIKRMWRSSRTRDVISIFVNDLEYDRSFGKVELVSQFENNTIPTGQREVVNNQAIESSDAVWGTVIASMGPGLRYKVAPFQVDNDLRLQLLGRVGYFYTARTSATGANLVLPPDTMLYGFKLRGRYDGMRRNLLELPHEGMAAGFDLDYMHRDHWAGFGTLPGGLSSKDDTQTICSSTATSRVSAASRACLRRTGCSSASTSV